MTRKRKSKSVEAEDAVAKPVYLVVEHKVEQPSHSIVVIAATTAPVVLIPLRHSKRGMSFTVLDSRWIVGVGGNYRCHFTIYDLSTSTESGGPWLYQNKVNPILIPHRDMLYILSSRPKIDYGADFLPWFEGIIFRDGRAPEMGCSPSSKLPPPPIFPYCIYPLEYLNPPDVRVAAYAVVDSHILLSVYYKQHHKEEEDDKGTCAFDMDKQVWDTVDDKSLPFLGQAIPLAGDNNNLFVARCKDNAGTAALYTMALFPAKDTSTGKKELSIVKLKQLDHPPIVLGQHHLCAPGMDGFSSFHVPSHYRSPDDAILEKARVIHNTYSLVKGGDIHLQLVKRQAFKLRDPSSFFAPPAPVVAAFTMDSE